MNDLDRVHEDIQFGTKTETDTIIEDTHPEKASPPNIGEALHTLADIALCVSNDFHTMHLNYYGVEFDTMHKKVLQKYYEQAAEDADSWYEAAAMFDVVVRPLNDASPRISWKQSEGEHNREAVINKCSELMTTYLAALILTFNALGENKDCAISIGIQNTVQGALEYWSKEAAFFNKRRA